MSLADIFNKLETWQQDVIAAEQITPIPPQGLPAHRMGTHWICDQVRQADKDYMRVLKPAVIKLINPSPTLAWEAMSWIDIRGHIALRSHPLSEEQNRLQADPVGTAKSHAAYWISQFSGPYASFPKERTYVMGINEPSVHNREEANRVALYTETFLKELQPHKIRAWVFNFSVGWPREDTGRIVWDEFLHLEQLIKDTYSYGCVHEYWYPTNLSGWGSYGNRVSRCPLKIPFIIGECGYTRQLAGLPQPWGWDGNISAEAYANMLWEYAEQVDPGKVFAVCPFTTSFGGVEWQSKDTIKAHAAILQRRRSHSWPNPWPAYSATEEPPMPVEDKDLIIFPKFTGKITGFYGEVYNDTYPHEGMDISMITGTPIYAAYDGVVAYAAFDNSYGHYIRCYHPELDICTFYAHLSERSVQGGNSIKAGQLIGYSGNTGNSSGPHLHFEIRLMNPNGTYRVFRNSPDTQPYLFRRNGRTDPLGWLYGWMSKGGKMEER